MKIGIDLRQLSVGASGGISQLVQGVFDAVFDRYHDHNFFVFCTPFNRSLLECDAECVRYFSLSIASYFQDLDRIANEEKLDVLFRSYPMEDTLLFPIRKQIFLIPDNQHEAFPDFFSPKVLAARRRAFSRALANAGAIGTISDFARKSLLNHPGTRCKDVFLMGPSLQVVHGLRKAEQSLSAAERNLIPLGEYFLFPANLWKHKNHVRLLEAFRLLRRRTGREISLVLTGHPEGWAEMSSGFSDLPVVHHGFVRPELLRVLLERASALVFFSLYEGFGIPLLEAFDAGTPVICSNTTSLPEVGGDAVITCDPTDVEAMAALMERILKEETLRETLVDRGRVRLKMYSWDKSAQSLVDACKRMVAEELSPTHDSGALPRSVLPLVSVVTPSYNQGRFLERTIGSVLAQTYPNIEYMVIDGGSKDESVKILQSYQDRFYWVSEPDRGQTDAINKGMARAKGDILAYLNSDDTFTPRAIERVVQYLQQYPDCDLVYGDADYIDENDRVIGRYNTAPYSLSRLLEDCMVCQPAAFWRRRVAEKVGPFDDQLNFAMDYDYWLRIAKSGGVIRFLPAKLASSRLYAETKTLSSRSEIYKEIFAISRKHTGQVHQSYYHGYWHHLTYEKSNFLSQLLRLNSAVHVMMARLHRRWDHRDHYLLPLLNFSVVKKLWRRVSGARVKGFSPDNWLAPTVVVSPKVRAPGHALHFAGIAPVDQRLIISAGKKEIFKCDFTAQQYKKVTFPADPADGKKITIRFSSFLEDRNHRKLAFFLQDTNLFAEHDTY